MIKDLSTPIMIIVSIVSAIAGYSWGVYTQVNPDYDRVFRGEQYVETINNTHSSAGMPDILRKPTTNRGGAVEEGALAEHGSADLVESVFYDKFIIKVTDTESTIDIVVMSGEGLPEGTLFNVVLNNKLLGEFSESELSFDKTLLASGVNKFIVTAVDGSGSPLLADGDTPLVARADLIQ